MARPGSVVDSHRRPLSWVIVAASFLAYRAIDGGPNSWFTSTGGMKGHDYYTNPNVVSAANQVAYSYPNTQGSAPIWFHDHTLGATRLNVYAGIAGAYYILDPAQEAHFQQIKMRPVTEVVPIILQDRQFDVNGQLYFPADFPGGLNGPSTSPSSWATSSSSTARRGRS